MLPIILAAPHGGRAPAPGIALRRGLGIPQFTTERDSDTAELAELVGAKLEALLGARPFLVVAHFERKFIDVNRAESGAFESASAKPYYDAYHRAIKEASSRVRQRWGSGLLLDIHGQGAEAETIFRGTNNGRSIALLRRRFGVTAVTGPKSILGHLAARGYRIEPTDDHALSRFPSRQRFFSRKRASRLRARVFHRQGGPGLRRNAQKTGASLNASASEVKLSLPITSKV